jgi:hypothetical protein
MKIKIVKKATKAKPQGYCMAFIDDIAMKPNK